MYNGFMKKLVVFLIILVVLGLSGVAVAKDGWDKHLVLPFGDYQYIRPEQDHSNRLSILKFRDEGNLCYIAFNENLQGQAISTSIDCDFK